MKAKRSLALFLTLLFVLALAPVAAGAKIVEVTKYKNIALNMPYTVSDEVYTGTAMPYQEVDGKELTDGKYGDGLYDTEWVAFDKRNTTDTAHYVTVDLGTVRNDIGQLKAVLRAASSDGVGLPDKIEFFSSADGTNFTSVGYASYVESDSNLDYKYTVPDEGTISGRYFRAKIGKATSGVFVFICEFEVGVADGTEEVYVPDEVLTITVSDVSPMTVGGGYVNGVPSKSTYNDVAGFFAAPVKVLTAQGAERTSGYLSTGDVMVLEYKGEEVDRAEVVVPGDVDGDGVIRVVDYAKVKRSVLGSFELTGAALKAAALGNGESVTVADYAKLKRHVLGTYTINGKNGPMLYDQEMTFKKVNDTKYTIETQYKGKTLLLDFIKRDEYTPGSSIKNWGTWNIGEFRYDGNSIASGSTDWEYVYRAASSASGSVQFTGGNHGNEMFLTVAFYNAETGEEIKLSNGQSVKVKGLEIVETTHLHWSNPDVYYAEVTRTYRYAGPRIELDVETTFVKSCWFTKSYTCMFPVYKAFGRNARIYNLDGTYHDSRTTDGTVYEAYSNHYDSGNSSLKVTFWGDSHPDWKFDVTVYTPLASLDNFSNVSKTMLWDMNQVSDKLYFSKYDDTKKTEEKPGTVYFTRSSWEFYVED